MQLLIFAFFALGFGETVGQVLLVRELLINFHGNELSLGVILANWLLLTAMGSISLNRLMKLPRNVAAFVLTQIAFCLILPVELILARTGNILTGVEIGEAPGLISIFYVSFLVLAPLCLTSGFQFALGVQIFSGWRNTPATAVGSIYAAEALGGMTGGVVFSYLLVYYCQPFEVVFYIGLLNLVAALILLEPWGMNKRNGKDKLAALLSGSIVLIMALTTCSFISGGADNLDEVSRQWQWRGHNLSHHQDSPYGNITLTQSNGQTNFYVSGLLLFTAPEPDTLFIEEIAHLPMLYHPSPQKVLLIGGGTGGVLSEILKHPGTEVHYVELDPLIIRVAEKHSLASALSEARVSTFYTDGRFFVRNAPDRYDVIILNLPPPTTLQLNRFYTREFFTEVANILNSNGILSFTTPASEVYLSHEMIRGIKCFYQTTKEILPNVLLIPGERDMILASPDARLADNDVELICRRFQDRKLETRLITLPYLTYKLSPERIQARLTLLRSYVPVETNSDAKPVATFYELVLWHSMFYPGLGRFMNRVQALGLFWFIPPGLLLITIILLRWRRVLLPLRLPPALAILTSGFFGMTLSTTLIFVFQIKHGSLYQKLGVMVAAFMLGLALGASVMNGIMNGLKSESRTLAWLELVIAIYSLLLPLAVICLSKVVFTEVPWVLLNGITGGLVGSEFPLANKIYLKGYTVAGKDAGTLYALDLLGAVLGTLAAGVFLLPILGIFKTCLLVSLFKMASLTLNLKT